MHGQIVANHKANEPITIELGRRCGLDQLAVAQNRDAVGVRQRLFQRNLPVYAPVANRQIV